MSENPRCSQFEVVGRSKTEKIVKRKRKVIYRISLKSVDNRDTHVLTDEDSALISKYPFGSIVSITVGHNPQTTLPKTS